MKIAETLLANPTGLTRKEMVEILSISPRARYNFEITLRRHPLTYIARWKGVEAVWKIVKVPEDCPPPYRKKLNETSSND